MRYGNSQNITKTAIVDREKVKIVNFLMLLKFKNILSIGSFPVI